MSTVDCISLRATDPRQKNTKYQSVVPVLKCEQGSSGCTFTGKLQEVLARWFSISFQYNSGHFTPQGMTYESKGHPLTFPPHHESAVGQDSCHKRLYMRPSKDACQCTENYFQMEQCQVVCNKRGGSLYSASIGRFIFPRSEKGRDAFECTSRKALYFQEGLEAPWCLGGNR